MANPRSVLYNKKTRSNMEDTHGWYEEENKKFSHRQDLTSFQLEDYKNRMIRILLIQRDLNTQLNQINTSQNKSKDLISGCVQPSFNSKVACLQSMTRV